MTTKLIVVTALVIVAATPLRIQTAMAKKGDVGSYDVGYKHGCSDASLPPSARYINQPHKGPSQHSGIFMQGYDAGFAACSGHSNGTASNIGGSGSSSSSSVSGGGSASSSSSSSGGPIIINNFR
jgi:hypothetical protein